MRTTHAKPGIVSLIATGSADTVPPGFPYGALFLASLDTDEVREWLARNKQFAIYVMAGAGFESDGVPALSVPVTEADFDMVVSAMPR
jgi:hypothetical protein